MQAQCETTPGRRCPEQGLVLTPRQGPGRAGGCTLNKPTDRSHEPSDSEIKESQWDQSQTQQLMPQNM